MAQQQDSGRANPVTPPTGGGTSVTPGIVQIPPTSVNNVPLVNIKNAPVIAQGFAPVLVNAAKINSTGGIAGTNKVLVMPVLGLNGIPNIQAFNSANFNSEEDVLYRFRSEDVREGRCVTIRGVRIIYKNIGPALIQVGVEVFSRENKTFNYSGQSQVIGTDPADNKLYTINFNIIATGERPQLSIFRAAYQGQMAITSATMYGEGIESDPI